jgi:hypothetical protein
MRRRNVSNQVEKELTELLRNNPELLDLQLEISKNLARLDSSEQRMLYLQEKMLDSLQELKVCLDGLLNILNA